MSKPPHRLWPTGKLEDSWACRPGLGREGLSERLPWARPKHAVAGADPYFLTWRYTTTLSCIDDLRGFRRLAACDGNDLADGAAVQGDGQPLASRPETADDLGDTLGGEVLAAGIFPLGTVRQEEIALDLQAAAFEDGSRLNRALAVETVFILRFIVSRFRTTGR